MKIYCKPYETEKFGLNGKVLDLLNNTTPYPTLLIDDIYYYYEYQVERMAELLDEDGNTVLNDEGNPIMVEAADNEGNPLYDIVKEPRLKDCVVEFDISDESKSNNKTMNERNNLQKLRSTYWVDKIGILNEEEFKNPTINNKDKEIVQKMENFNLKQRLNDIELIISDAVLGGL